MNIREILKKIDLITETAQIVTQNDGDGTPEYFKVINNGQSEDDEFETFPEAQHYVKSVYKQDIQAPVPAEQHTVLPAGSGDFDSGVTGSGRALSPVRAAQSSTVQQNRAAKLANIANMKNPQQISDPQSALSSVTNQVGNMGGNQEHMRNMLNKLSSIGGMHQPNTSFSNMTTSNTPSMPAMPKNGNYSYSTSSKDPNVALQQFSPDVQNMFKQFQQPGNTAR